MLYGSYPYAIGYHPGIRLRILLNAAAWTALLTALAQSVLDRTIHVLTSIGTHTLPIYLLHGFAVKVAAKFAPTVTVPAAVVCSVAVIALFGNSFTAGLFNRLFSGKKPGDTNHPLAFRRYPYQ